MKKLALLTFVVALALSVTPLASAHAPVCPPGSPGSWIGPCSP